MKKLILTYAAILVGVYVVLTVLSSKSDYAVEKELWNINKRYADIAKDPNVIPGEEFISVISRYDKLIGKYPKSRLVPGMRMLIARVFAMKKDYETSREKFYEIIGLYPDNVRLITEVLSSVGKTYEMEGKWGDAQKVYDGIMKQYPATDIGMTVPLYIANHYKTEKDFPNTAKAYQAAVQQYTKLVAEHPDTAVEFFALRYLANTYLEQTNWTPAVETLGKIIEKYGSPKYLKAQQLDIMIKTINVVTAYQLKDYDTAIRIYSGILERNPNHPMRDYFNKMISALNTLKKEGVQVAPAK